MRNVLLFCGVDTVNELMAHALCPTATAAIVLTLVLTIAADRLRPTGRLEPLAAHQRRGPPSLESLVVLLPTARR